MKFMRFTAALGLFATAMATHAPAQSPNDAPPLGRWDATLTIKNAVVPFRLDIADESGGIKGILYNGDETETTTAASYREGRIVLNLEHYLTKISATYKNGELDGKVDMRNGEGGGYPFHARRNLAATPVSAESIPNIDGVWEIPHEKPTPKGESAWRFIVKQRGAEASATILRVDGDTGALTGTFHNGSFTLSHFDGSRPGLIEVKLTADGTLDIQESASNRPGHFIAYRPEVARAKGLPEPADYTRHTTVRDPNERFTFSFPDVNGKIISSDDPKFKDKVVVAIVTGTWCPNCHDEAQYLAPLYRKYRDQGVEIVALDFEEPEQQDQLSRVKAFVRQYGIEYTYLIAGAPAEMWEKVPQAVNLNTWPATFFIGRDGLVKAIHAGFAAPASGPFNSQLKDEFTSTLDRLLREDAPKLSARGQ